MDVSMSENNEEPLPPANEIVGEIEEHMFNLDELNILGMKEDRNIVTNLMEAAEIEPSTESLQTNDTNVQSPTVEGEVLDAEKSAEDNSENASPLRKHLIETEVDKENVSAMVECNLESHEEVSVERSEGVGNVDTIIAADEGNSNSLQSIPKVGDGLEVDIVEDGKDKGATEVEGCKSTVVSEISQSGDEVVEMEQDESSEVIQLDEAKDDEVVALNQNKENEVSLNEKDSADVKETEVMEFCENTSGAEDVTASSVPETVDNAVNEEQQNHSHHEQDDKEEEVIQVSNPVAESHRERGRRKRSTSLSLLNTSGNSTSVHEDEDLDDSITGRPRRKAAEIAGNQIKQIVNSEEELIEVAGKKKDAEEWSEAAGSYPRMICFQCCRFRSCQYHLLVNGISRYMCSTTCFQAFRRNHTSKNTTTDRRDSELRNAEIIPSVEVGVVGERKTSSATAGKPADKDHTPKCAFCDSFLECNATDERKLSWETMEFCDEDCLGRFQDQLGSSCSQCKLAVQRVSMGKYCVRFGYNIKQFCCSTCLEEFKKGLKSCTYCQKDISSGAEGFLAPVGDKGQFKDFCTPTCMEKYDHISSGTRPPIKVNSCAVCNKPRPVFVELIAGKLSKDTAASSKSVTSVYGLCSEPCFAAFKYVNHLKTEQCESCMRQFDTSLADERPATFFHDGGYHCCCRACLNVYILTHRRIVQCNWCRVKKYDFDMIKRVTTSGKILMMCSLNCLNLFQVSVKAVSSQRNMEQEERQANYAEYMRNYRKRGHANDSTVRKRTRRYRERHQHEETVEEAMQRRAAKAAYMRKYRERNRRRSISQSPIIDDGMQCDHCKEFTQAQYHLTMSDATVRNFCTYDCVMSYQSRYSRAPLTLPEDGSTVDSGRLPSNEADSDLPAVPVISSVQSLAPTDNIVPADQGIIPTSLTMAQPENFNSMARVSEPINGMPLRQIIVMPPDPKPVQNKMTSCKPTMVSKSVSCQTSLVDSSTQTDERPPIALVPIPVPIYVPMPMHMYCNPFPIPVPFALPLPVPIVIPSTLAYEEIKKRAQVFESVAPEEAEILMMAELVADEEPKEAENEADPGELSSPTEDCENPVQSDVASDSESEDRWKTVDLEELIVTSSVVGPAYIEELCEGEQPESESGTRQKKKAAEKLRSIKAKQTLSVSQGSGDEDESTELKAFLGVNAWSVWVQQKNSELSKVASNSIRLKLFKTDLLQMNLEELNYALCLFVKEVRKPGGEMYAADTIFYFCLGIQHYLAENGRLDNIFTDLYFEKFTECLDQVAMTFPPLTKETSLISTRVSEEHLWESRQLGAHSPYVLLSTLVFFNTKYFHLWTVDDHAKLKFASVVKVLKKGRGRPSTEVLKPGSSGGRAPGHSILRYTHPDSDEKVYEQHENLETPLRCPVKLYEFYLSRCPEPVRRGGDLFYLLPERACVPDSPVWYSSIALGFDALGKIIHRIKMVKEICEAYVSDEIPS